MAYKFRTAQNQIQTSKSYQKWYAASLTLNNISTEQLCDEISHSCTVTESDVRGALTEIAVVISQHLKNNDSVKIDGLGTFFVRLSSVPTEKPEEFKSSQIKSARVGFRPETEIASRYLDERGKIRRITQKKLLKGINFEKFGYDTKQNFIKKGALKDKTDSTSTEG